MKKIIPCGFHCIKFNNLGVSFGDQQVLSNINLNVHCGNMTAIIAVFIGAVISTLGSVNFD